MTKPDWADDIAMKAIIMAHPMMAFAKALRDRDALARKEEKERFRELLADLAEPVCDALCPTVWKTAEGQQHSNQCKAIKLALST